MKKLLTEKDLNGLLAKEYCRKSNESEDKQTHSLEDQHLANRKSIERVGLISYGQYFEEAKSAKRRGRPLFNQMIEEIEKGKYSVIVCFHLNRLSRNAVDAGFLIELFDQGKLKAIVTNGKTYFNTGEDKFMMQIELGLAKKSSDDLWPVVERGMVSKVHRQWWPSKPKPGYLNYDTSELTETIQIVDPIRFPLLREAVDEILLGISPADALRNMNKKGYRTRKTRNLGNKQMSTTNFYKFLNDPYYYGRLIWNGEESTLHSDLPRLMTEQEYWKIQSILGQKGIERPKEKMDIPYRGLLKCSCCNKSIVVYSKDKIQKDGSVKTHYYTKRSKKELTPNCKQGNVPLKVIEEQMQFLLEQVTIPEAFYNWAKKWLTKEHKEQSGKILNGIKNSDSQIQAKREQLSKLLQLRINEEVDKEEYSKHKTRIENEIKELQGYSSIQQSTDKDWREQMERVLDIARFAKENFNNASPTSKAQIMRSLGSNFLLDGSSLGITIEKPFEILIKNKELINDESNGVEPLENAENTTKDSCESMQKTIWWARRESNPHSLNENWILSPACLPFHHSPVMIFIWCTRQELNLRPLP